MSYSFEMVFMAAESKADAFLRADQLVNDAMSKNVIDETIRNQLFYFHQITDQKPLDKWDYKDTELFRRCLHDLFVIQCTYWPQQKLVGIKKGCWLNSYSVTACKGVHFQNGTDQDYEYNYWPTEISFFQNHISAVQKIPAMDIIQKSDLVDIDDGVPDENYLCYLRRSYLYTQIFNDLELDSWLYGPESHFQRFSLTGIVSTDREHEVYSRARRILLLG